MLLTGAPPSTVIAVIRPFVTARLMTSLDASYASQ